MAHMPSACSGVTLRKHPRVHTIQGSRMSSKEIIILKKYFKVI